ncbi:hypothetical protein E3N88_22212 [Mikania micrantha]|uniref:CCHC-type domain-containing protein n=1 Tax=Mikania micrantha TaxID=192012 RepID=A0A5N6N9U8_9ASTR|nr:hypothetical protein E3N88_22212 [Mikania micrantha]
MERSPEEVTPSEAAVLINPGRDLTANPNTNAIFTSSSVRPEWPTIDGPLGLSEHDSVGYARKFFGFGFLLLPLLWAVNCYYFWPVLRHASSFPRIRPSRRSCALRTTSIKANLEGDGNDIPWKLAHQRDRAGDGNDKPVRFQLVSEPREDHWEDQGNQAGQTERRSNISFQCPTLTSTNYPIWSLRIKAILKAHGIWDVIEPGTNLDQKKDNAAIAYLYQSLPEDILQVASCEHAKDIWDSIKTRHLGVERVMEARLQSLRTEFDTLRMSDGETVDDFVAKLSGIASKSATLGSVIEEPALVRKLLTSMPESFLNMVATIEQLPIGRPQDCKDWEAKKRAEKGNGRGRGAKDRGRGRGRGCGRGRCGGRGRGAGRNQASTSGAQGSSSYKKDRSQLQCFRCDALGHFFADCPTRRQEEVNQTQANADRPALLMTVTSHAQKELIYLTEDKVYPATHTPSQDEQSMWYLDNGASNHMTGDKGLFSKLDTKIVGNVRFGDGSCVDIEGRGTILLECKNGEHKLLTEVYYIPFLKSNIISLGQLIEGGCKILMKQDLPVAVRTG